MANKGFFGKTVKLVDNPAISIHMRNRKKNNFVPQKTMLCYLKIVEIIEMLYMERFLAIVLLSLSGKSVEEKNFLRESDTKY